MKKKKLFLTAVTTVLAASALVSCGKNSSSDNKKDDDNKTITETLPADMHKVYFIIDGEVVGTVDYKEGASSILEYQVPAREGYIGKWDSYTLGDKDVYVTARYFKLNVNYKVEYYLENLENSQYTISANDTQTFSAKAYDEVIPTVKSFDHFTCTNPNIEGTVLEDGSTVLKLYYSRDTYTINYVTNNGTTIAPQTVKYGAKLTQPTLTKDGYDLTGFKVGDQDYDFNTPVSSNLTIEAKFNAKDNIRYKVNYYQENLEDDNYSLVIADSFATTGNTDELIRADLKDYVGFELDEEKSNLEGTIKADGSLELNVYYKRKRLNVSFVTNTSDTLNPQIVKYGSKISCPQLGKAGYEFKGYKYDSENFFNFNNTITTDLTLTASFDPIKVNYKINYYQQDFGASYVKVQTDCISDQAYTGTVITIDKLYQGFNLNTAKSTLEATVKADGSTELNVYYDRKELEINFVTNNGTELESKVIKYYQTIEEPVLEKEGYNYVGWKCNGVDFNFADPILTSMTLECVFAPAQNTVYTMRYNYEKANEDGYDQETSTYYGTTGEDAYIYYQNSKTGFDLKETPTTKKIEADGSTIIDIYYDRLRVRVDYQATLSGVNLDPVYVKYGTAMKNLIPDLTRDGYSCRYYNSSYGGWFDADTTTSFNYLNQSTVFLYWDAKPQDYKVQLYFENITDDEYTLDDNYTDSYSAETDAYVSVEPYEFEGFEFNASLSNIEAKIPADNSTVLKLYYKRIRYTIKVYTNTDDVVIPDIIAKHGSKISLDPISRQGYTFDGWFVNDSYEWNFNSDEVTHNYEMYAHWTANQIETKVEYYYENVNDNDYTLKATDYIYPYADEDHSLEYDVPYGYNVSDDESVVQSIINPDGSTVFKVYYKRYRLTINFNTGIDGINVDPILIKYGQVINIDEITSTINRPGYTLDYWYDKNGNYQGDNFFSTSVNLSAHYTLKTNIQYTVRYFQQNIDDDEYTLIDDETFTNGNVETSFNTFYNNDEEYFENYFGEGFHNPDFNDKNIKADGTTVIDLYYQRRTYRVLVSHDSYISCEFDNNTYCKYGTKINIEATYEKNLAYPYIGMYDYDGNHLTDELTFEYIVQAIDDYTIFIKTEMLAELENFAFSSSDEDIVINGYNGEETEDLVIPDCATKIGSSAFYGSQYNSITLGANIREISNSAFYGLPKNSVIFNDKLEKIGYQAFAYAELGDFVLPDSVTDIDTEAFYCANITSLQLPANLKNIGYRAFSEYYYNTTAKKMTISAFPKTIETIGDSAFYNRELSQITFVSNSNLKSIGNGAFTRYNSKNDEDEAIYDIFIPASCETIGDDAFTYLLINSIVFEENSNLKSIGSDAFELSTESIYEDLKLNDLILPKSLEYIGSDAFQCRYFSSISFEEGTTLDTLGDSVFYKIKTDSFEFAPSIKHIGDYAFNQFVTNEIIIPNTVETIGAQCFISAKIDRVIFEENSQIKTIPSSAFQQCSVSYLVFPDSLEFVEDYAFFQCNNLSLLNLPSTVKTISEWAFYNCELSIIYVPESLYEIGNCAFDANNNLDYIFNYSMLGFENGEPEYGQIPLGDNTVIFNKDEADNVEIDGDFVIEHISSTETKLLKYLGTDSSVRLPNYLTSIGDRAFYQNYYINFVDIPDHVTSIGEYAFYCCVNLYSIELGSSLSSIEEGAFEGCELLVEIYNRSSLTLTQGDTDNGYVSYKAFTIYEGDNFVSHIETTEDYLLYNDVDNDEVYLLKYIGQNIEDGDLYIPENITHIYESAFWGMFSGKHINIICNENLKSIGYQAFSCSHIENIELNEGLTSIGDYAFSDTYSLNSVTLPSTISSIGYAAFYSSSIKTITINEDCTSIEDYAFNSSKITNVIFAGNSKLETIGYQAFANVSRLKSFYLGENVTYIGDDAFANTHLFEIKNDSSLELTLGANTNGKIAKYADYIYSSSSGSSRIHENEDGFVYYEKSDESAVILIDYVGETGDNIDLVIPSNITEIDYIENLCGVSFNTITISKNVKIIADDSFSGAYAKEIIFEEGSQLEKIGIGVFSNSYLDQDIIDIPDSVTYLGDNAFSSARCRVFIAPKSVTYIGQSFMWNNIFLEYIIFKDGSTISEFGASVFAAAAAYRDLNIILPTSVTNINIGYIISYQCLNVFYYGTAEQYASITSNDLSCSKDINVYYYSATENNDGSHWHLDDDGYPVIWESE